jgi:hypothetical protein
MKDLIMITAYCPDDYRENILRNLVTFLNDFRDQYDVMIVSHTVIPIDIQKKVNYCLYDSKNEILTDWDLLNQPWFNPDYTRRIQSSFLSKKNTHLAIWRMFILGFSLSKNIGYKKIHQIEYDCDLNNIFEFDENSKLLNEYDSVIYIDKKENVDDILFGSFQSYQVLSIDDFLLNLDEDGIKNMIRNSDSKSPELMLQNILEKNKKVLKKNKVNLEKGGNKFGIVDGQIENKFIPWAVPYYDQLEETIGFVVWNTKKEQGVEHTIIINNQKVIQIEKTLLNHWRIINLGNFYEITDIMIIENDEIRDKFKLSTEKDREIFKKSSFRHKEIF